MRFVPGFALPDLPGPDPEAWARIFSDPSAWGDEPGGVLEFREGSRRVMLVATRDGARLSLNYRVKDRERREDNRDLVSAPHPDRMKEPVILPDEIAYPAGSFLDGPEAGAAAAEFLKDPMTPPPSVPWLQTADVLPIE